MLSGEEQLRQVEELFKQYATEYPKLLEMRYILDDTIDMSLIEESSGQANVGYWFFVNRYGVNLVHYDYGKSTPNSSHLYKGEFDIEVITSILREALLEKIEEVVEEK